MKKSIQLIFLFLASSNFCFAQLSDLFFYRQDGGTKFMMKDAGNEEQWTQSSYNLDIAPIQNFETVIAEDFNGDGCSDLFFYRQDGGTKFMIKDMGDEQQWTQSSYNLEIAPIQNFEIVIAEDFNGDGIKDLFFYRQDGGTKFMIKDMGDEQQWTQSSYNLDIAPIQNFETVIAEDFNGDGIKDLFFYRQDGGTKFMIKDVGDEQQWTQSSYNLDIAPIQNFETVIAEDFNGDGIKDLFFYRQDGGTKFMIKDMGDEQQWTQSGYNFDIAPIQNFETVIAEDFNGDGIKDLFFYRQDGGTKFMIKDVGDEQQWTQSSYNLEIAPIQNFETVIAEDFNCTVVSTDFLDPELFKLTVFPNPVKDEINLKIDSKINLEMNFSMYDLSGKKVLELPNIDINLNSGNYTIPVPEINEGIYILEYRTEKGIGSQKIMISK